MGPGTQEEKKPLFFFYYSAERFFSLIEMSSAFDAILALELDHSRV
jgi:hypothetical protein